MNGAEGEEKVKLDALIDNTAQGIFNYLKEVENKREVYQKRWVWELLQNALDAAPSDRKVDLWFLKQDRELIFRHNGRPFTREEVAHLIYHGSTKKGTDIGKFGTGFLVTHLLSKKVDVKGIREDGKGFDFPLDRNGSSADEIKKLMEDTWDKYQKSLNQIVSSNSYSAEFRYELANVSLGTVDSGISTLQKHASYVLAFNDKLNSIKLSLDGHTCKYQLIETIGTGSCLRKIVREDEEGKQSIFHEITMIDDGDIQIAVKLENEANGSAKVVQDLRGISKIFIGFPLVGTEDVPYPVILNSRRFEPTERRDGIFLGKEKTEYILRNKELLQKAKNLVVALIKNAEVEKWENIHILLNLGSPPQKDWLDTEWYVLQLRELLSEIMGLKVVRNENKDFITFTQSFMPTLDDLETDKIESFWSVLYQVSDYKDKLPAKTLATEWARILAQWKSLNINLTQREITLEKFAQEIESCGNISGFKEKLLVLADEIQVLNDFYKLLLMTKRERLFSYKNILLDQDGMFRKLPSLFRDTGIDEELKDIALQLGKNVRSYLIHKQVDADVQNLLQGKGESEVLREVLEQKNASLKDKSYLKANVELLKWLINHNKLDLLEGYPVQAQKADVFPTLSSKEKLLAPKDIWDVRAGNFSELFPDEFILSSIYANQLSRDEWEKLQDKGFIILEPLYSESEKLSKDDLEFLVVSSEKLDEEKDHETSDKIAITKLAFLETKDRGVIDRVRKAKDRAQKFLEFLFRYVVEKDSQWSNPVEVNCSCGARHRIYPAHWLAKLKDRYWVPVRKDKSERPSAQYLALLVANVPELLQMCKQDKPSKLLNILNVPVSDLLIHTMAKDETTRWELDKAIGSLYSAFISNPSEISKLAKLVEIDPLFMQEVEKRLLDRERIQSNQAIGTLVETLLKEALEKEGFKVTTTRVGSDFVLEHDFIKDDKEAIVELQSNGNSFLLIEVKSTMQDYVKMTLTQAKEAGNNQDKYVLCVVELTCAAITEQAVKDGAKFIQDIGSKIQDAVNKVEKLQKQQEQITQTDGNIEIEVAEGPVRLKVKKPMWETGLDFEGFIKAIARRG